MAELSRKLWGSDSAGSGGQSGPRFKESQGTSYPFQDRQDEFDKEIGGKRPYVMDMGPTMPTIQIVTRKSSDYRIGDSPRQTGTKNRDGYEASKDELEKNYHDQWVQ